MPLKELISILDKLVVIKEYLTKVGPQRRLNSQTAKNKFSEARELHKRLESILSIINSQSTEPSISSQIDNIQKVVDDFSSIYKKILKLEQISEEVTKMESNFDLKTALALLPVMNNREEVTLQLIDGITLYSSMIESSTHKLLIEFVLKTRLSASAKLRLKSTYDSVKNLIIDMKTLLIQKKSSVAIQTQLLNSRQGNRSIENFGSEIEQLFVNLTISQAEGNDKTYDILRPLNEKIAIKRFSDGLSDTRLSTIIASRNFSSLPEAIRSAIDEETLTPKEDNNQLLSFNREFPNRNYQTVNRYSNGRVFYNRGRGANNNNYRPRNDVNFQQNRNFNQNWNNNFHQNRNFNQNWINYSGNDTRFSGSQQWRGPTRGGTGSRGVMRPHMSRVQHVAEVDDSTSLPTTTGNCTEVTPDSMTPQQFFRAYN